ncbi:hypothetical protein SI65_02268 [Aspergillus cristatus]|uniref:Uncharacterized protein n=1 Tax=Aspergillus cristatus TaxID=573508 RepID=A0A1E3BKE4_ASPCR|nr:hypothetical protein SI65_02268 [Aspergillus cristatus]
MGTPQEPLDGVGMIGYPVPGNDDRYAPLCVWSCATRYCTQTLCGTQQVTPVARNDTWYLHDTCTSGTGEGKLAGLCQFGCAYGYCPKHACQCKETGSLVAAPSGKPILVTVKPWLDPFLFEGLCNFACSHGYCPSAICDGPTMIGGLGDVVYLDPEIWRDPAPTLTCSPPCTLVPAPLTLGTPTLIEFEPWTTVIPYSLPEDMETTFGSGQTTHYTVYSSIDITTALQIEPVTTTAIDVWAITISDTPEKDEVYMTSSIQPPPFVITIITTHDGKQWPPMTTTITPFPYPTSRLIMPDPALNTRPTKITTGILFCEPDCPHCPPEFIPGITLPPGAVIPPPTGSEPPPAGNPNDTPTPTPTTNPTTTASASTSTDTRSTTAPKQTTLAPTGTMIVDTMPTREDYMHLLGTASPTLSSSLSSIYSTKQAHASDGTYYSRTSTIPASAVTGIAVASYELCNKESAPPCTHIFAIHAVSSPTWRDFSSCQMKQALYTTEVSSGIFSMTLAATPSIGPFDDGVLREVPGGDLQGVFRAVLR